MVGCWRELASLAREETRVRRTMVLSHMASCIRASVSAAALRQRLRVLHRTYNIVAYRHRYRYRHRHHASPPPLSLPPPPPLPPSAPCLPTSRPAHAAAVVARWDLVVVRKSARRCSGGNGMAWPIGTYPLDGIFLFL